MVTSPTYWNERGEARGDYLGVEKSVDTYLSNLMLIFDQVKKVLKDEGSMWVTLGDDPRNSRMGIPLTFASVMKQSGWDVYRLWFWDKDKCSVSSTFTNNKHDCIFQFVKKGAIPYYDNAIALDNVDFEVPKAVRWEGSYTVAYPMEMLIRMVASSSPLDGIVLDPFLGTGTTALVAATLNRHAIGIDTNENELDIANRRMMSFERNGYIEKTWLHEPGGYSYEEEGPRILLGGSKKLTIDEARFGLDVSNTVVSRELNRRKVTVRKEVQKGMDFTPLWLSKSCCDDECACVANNGCQCQHDCQCPDKSLPHTIESMSSDSLAIKMHNYTKSTHKYAIMDKEGGTWQEPAQVGYFETNEPGIDEKDDTKAPESVRKGGGAEWARAQGLVPESGDWKHPKHWVRPDEVPKEHRGYKIPSGLVDVELNINPEHRQIARGRDAAGRRKYIYRKDAVEKGQAEMFDRVKEFGKIHNKFMAQLRANLGTGNDENDVLYLITQTGFRVGSDRDTKAKVDAYGASTIRATHISVHGDTSTINFIGKAGVIIQKEVTDRLLARMLRGRLANKRDMEKVFNTQPSRVLKQLRAYTGRPFQVKDLRDHVGIQVAEETIGRTPKPTNLATFKTAQKIVAEEVAKVLGNTPAVALANYIPQEMFAQWESDLEDFVSKELVDNGFDFRRDVMYDVPVRWTERNSWRGEDE